MLIGTTWLVLNEPHPHPTTLLTGQTFDVLSVNRDPNVGQLLRRIPESRLEAVLVSYYSSQHDLDSPAASQEAHDVLQIGVPLALQNGDSLIAVQPIRTVGPHWSPIIRGRIHFFERSLDGTWDEIFPSQAQAETQE